LLRYLGLNNMKKVELSPSILSADWNNLKFTVSEIQKAGCKYLHFDVMDGHFVPNISFGIPVLKCLTSDPDYKLISDVHLMISDPYKYVEPFVKAKADILTFHLEALENKEKVIELIEYIHSFNVKAGISVKPNTKVEELIPFLDKVDLVLVMSVEPGYGGQKFMDSCLPKIKFLSEYKKEHAYSYLIEVDGGINNETVKLVKEAGVEVVVAGSYVTNGNIVERCKSLNE